MTSDVITSRLSVHEGGIPKSRNDDGTVRLKQDWQLWDDDDWLQ